MISHRPMIKLMAIIVDRDKVKTVTDLFRTLRVHFGLVTLAKGTANSEIMDYLGLGSVDKALIVSLEPDFRAGELLEILRDRLRLSGPGKGIAFTLPLSGVCGPLTHMADEELQNSIQNEVERQVENISKDIKHSLIVVIVNEGFSDDVMDAAKEAGANGGTVLLARRIGAEDAVKFFGVELRGEKEVVTMLVDKEKKRGIMQAVNHACGMRTEARGMIFSMPVDSVVGLSSQ